MTEFRREPVAIPAAWRATDLARSTAWIYRFDAADIAELDRALENASAKGATPETLTRAQFPLGALERKLARMRAEIESGVGVALIKDLPIARWGEAVSLLAYAGIGVHLGELTAQNASGRFLDHVRATGRDWDKDPTVRGYQTTSFLPYHCDKGDVVGLLCLHGAKSGGESCIASSAAIHNAVLARRPDLFAALYSPLYVDLRGEEPKGAKPYYLQPMYGWYKGRLFGRMGRKYVESAQRFPELPRLTPEQIEAMEYVEALGHSDEFRFDMIFEQGDIQLLNNHVIMHSRKRYEDWPEPARWRHLVRMLVFTEGYRDVPDYVDYINNVTRWWRDNPRLAAAAE